MGSVLNMSLSFSDDLDDRIHCVLIEAEHATKLAGVVGTSKDRIRIQNDLDKLKDLKSIR